MKTLGLLFPESYSTGVSGSYLVPLLGELTGYLAFTMVDFQALEDFHLGRLEVAFLKLGTGHGVKYFELNYL